MLAKTSFVSQVVGSVTKKQELTISKQLAEHLADLGLVDYPKKLQVQASTTDVGQVEQSASLPVETASPTTTLKTSGRAKRGKQSL